MVAMITLAAFAAYAGTFLTQTRGETTSIIEALRKGIIKQGQLLSVVYHWERVDGATTRIEVSVYNYGYSEIKPRLIFIDSTPQDEFSLTDIDGSPVSSIKPGVITKISVTVPYVVQGVMTGQGYEFALFTEENVAYAWWL